MAAGTIIIGAGHAGIQAAASMRLEGYDGPIRVLTDERSLPYHKPPLSKTFLKQPEPRPQLLRAEGFYTSNNIILERGVRVVEIRPDAHRIRLSCGREEPYDKLILATGARPRPLSLPEGGGLQGAQIAALRTVADAEALRAQIAASRSLVIVGAGFIGLELAATLAALGKTVTVTEMSDRVLGRVVAPAVSSHILATLRTAGVTIHLNSGLSMIGPGREHRHEMRLTGGERIEADLLVSSIGVEPDTGLARAAGLNCDNGILVDGLMQTSDPDILAIGDCARFPHQASGRLLRLESVQAATDQARTAAATLCGRIIPYAALPWFWSDIGDQKLQMAGISTGADQQVLLPAGQDGAFSVCHFAGSRLLAVDSVNRPADHLLARKMLNAGFSPRPEDVAANRLAEAFAAWQSMPAIPADQ
ncbi:NAD(P)/FAD-dependent oxidoreductase [Rhodobacter sp. 24-YEA-8]|uniref:NAD(P)/FAD-dependent oxidoreductase n=1 Tax=Rhodobacter sp. 24-YEA-8 TaxID=1884310 RepID=UPI000897B8FD|nr:FAD-dependent oxidoreductase [Rhodobacter sp. 24-YEA-8]SEB84505.1 3-phenylpropionate/trans-cinnamate dioxygenase ferredoxin reductase subunit [Rhodobacter sp. 24-YEA-8]